MKRITYYFSFIFIFLVFMVGYIIIHELIHAQILTYFGCENVKFGINQIGIYTQCMDEGYIWSEIQRLAHSITEIVGYTGAIFFAAYISFEFIKINKGENHGRK
jgi:hypothetical protein